MRRPLTTLAALTAGCLLAVPVADALAQQRPRNGAIAFAGSLAGKRVIFTRAANGRGLRVIPTGGRSEHPAFSPRGRRIVFTRQGNLGAQLWVEYVDGTGLRQLTSGPGDDLGQWSPDGEQVVFARGRRGARDLYRVLADGTGLRRLTTSARDDSSPAWSAKDEIAFVRGSRDHGHVYVVDAVGGAPVRLTHARADEAAPAWSPTGRTLVIARGRPGGRDLYLVTADGRHSRRLTMVSGDDSEPTWSPDGSRIAFTHTRGGKRRLFLMKVRGRAIRRLPSSRNRRVRRLTSSTSRSRQPSWQPVGLDPVVAAAGDIACDPGNSNFNGGLGVGGACGQKYTSDLMLRLDLARVLALGDDQYEDGQLSKFQRSFDPSWGRLKPLISPVPGNHEYAFENAPGYFDYFNGVGQASGAAGSRGAGYYSFDVGSWHLIALNSECRHIGGCGADSPQLRWLAQDLAAHQAACTLAYWHRPHFTSGGHSDKGDMAPTWSLLYAANAELILNGHDHFYERFAPQTPTGTADPSRGIREFIAGMGGKSRFGFPDIQSQSEVRQNGYFGVLQLTLRNGGYDWEARAAPSGNVMDSGTGICH